MNHTIRKINCYCRQTCLLEGSNEIIKCVFCNTYQHKACVLSFTIMEVYICPKCQFSYTDPLLNVISKVYLSNAIKFNAIPKNEYQDNSSSKIIHQVCQMIFQINLQEIKNHKSFDIHKSFIVINCLQLNDKGFNYQWPRNAFVKINNKMIYEVPQNVKPNRKEPQPIFLTFCKDIHKQAQVLGYNYYPYDQNFHYIDEYISGIENLLEIGIYKSKKGTEMSFLIGIDYLKANSEEEVINSLDNITNIKKLQVLQRKNNTDLEIDAIVEEISLLDPYISSLKITIPVRSITCLHMAVFDIKTFFTINKKGRKFKCPICGKNAKILYIDGFLKKLFNDNPQAEKLLIASDYSYTHEKDDSAQSMMNQNVLNDLVDDVFGLSSQVLNNSQKSLYNQRDNIINKTKITNDNTDSQNEISQSYDSFDKLSEKNIDINLSNSNILNTNQSNAQAKTDNSISIACSKISQPDVIFPDNNPLLQHNHPYGEENINIPIYNIPLQTDMHQEYNITASKNFMMMLKDSDLMYLNYFQQFFLREKGA